jgi:hypothetical protein
MSFEFSEFVLPDDENDLFNYDNFLSDSIYDWLNEPEAVLSACDTLDQQLQQLQTQTQEQKEEEEEEEEEVEQPIIKPKLVTIIQQLQPKGSGYYKKYCIDVDHTEKKGKKEKHKRMYQNCLNRSLKNHWLICT